MGERRPAAPSPDDTVEVDPDETTSQGDWPVAPQYQVTPGPPVADSVRGGRGAATPQPHSLDRMQWASRVAVLAAILALLVLVGAAAAWIVTGFDDPAGGASPSTNPPPATEPGSATPTAPTVGTRETETANTASTETNTTTDTPTEVLVPTVIGLQNSEAGRRIRDAGLRAETRLVVSSRPAGTVVAQKPEAGDRLDRGGVVDLRVAKEKAPPPAPVTIRVPDLIGTTASGARSRLRALGLRSSFSEVASDEAEGTVVGQAPTARAEVRKGATVILSVSTGPALIAVPDVTGLDERSARQRLESTGFEVTVVDQPTADPAQAGTVVSQDPAGGAEAERRSTVTITVARVT
jgi:beta-lactam-binding protein with PASTA domain